MNFYDTTSGADELLQRAAEAAHEHRAEQLTYDQIAKLIDAGGSASSGAPIVTWKTALEVSTVLACARVISEGCCTPDVTVYRDLPDGTTEKALNIPESRLLSRRPNEFQTSLEWRRMMTLHAVMSGAGLSIKIRGDNRRLRELIPVPPGHWHKREIGRYQYVYDCYDQWGKIGTFAPEDVFVLNGLQWDWLLPLDAVRVARGAIGLAMSTDRSLQSQQNNGLKTSGVYSVDGALNEEQHNRLTAWVKAKTGAAAAGTPLVLDRAAKWTPTAQTNADGQTTELRAQTIEEVCRAFNVFPIMVGHSDKAATFASSEAFFSAHLKHTIIPWQRNWCQSVDEFLLDGSGPLSMRFDNRYLTAGSMKDRSFFLKVAAETGVYTRNELRDEEGMDPLPGLDTPLTPTVTTTGVNNDPAKNP